MGSLKSFTHAKRIILVWWISRFKSKSGGVLSCCTRVSTLLQLESLEIALKCLWIDGSKEILAGSTRGELDATRSILSKLLLDGSNYDPIKSLNLRVWPLSWGVQLGVRGEYRLMRENENANQKWECTPSED